MHDEEFIVNTPKGDYAVSITHDFEEDNVKAWTEVISPDGRFAHLDITPYSPERNLIRRMIRFHSMFGYWVTRHMVESGGPVEMHELEKIFEEAIVSRADWEAVESDNTYREKFNV